MDYIANESYDRLDKFLAKELKTSRNQLSSLIKSNRICVNGVCVSKPSFKINEGDKISVEISKVEQNLEKFDMPFEVEILYEDEYILVINKPANLVVHPAPSVKEATLVDWLKSKGYTLSTLNGEIRAGIVHRLDKGTSGVMVVAKTNEAHANLSTQLSDKSMGRIYLMFCNLGLKENCLIQKPIGRNPKNRLKQAVVNGARYAKSAFLNLHCEDKFNFLAAKLFTGRTHQIRVHLSSINRYILGDNLYGFKSENDKLDRIMLHAYLLYFTHPITKEMIKVKAEIPNEFKEKIDKSQFKESIYEKINKDAIVSLFDGCNEWLCVQ